MHLFKNKKLIRTLTSKIGHWQPPVYLERQQDWEEFPLISDQHTVADARKFFFDLVFDKNWRHVLSAGGDQQLCKTRGENKSELFLLFVSYV